MVVEPVEKPEQLVKLARPQAGERVVLEAFLVGNDRLRAGAALVGEPHDELAAIRLGAFPLHQARGLELAHNLGERGRGGLGLLEQDPLGHLAVGVVERLQDMLLAAAAAAPGVDEVAEEADVMQDAALGRLGPLVMSAMFLATHGNLLSKPW